MKRRDVLAVHSIDHFGLEVPDLEEARHFYEAFGLEVKGDGEVLSLHTFGNPHRWGQLFKAAAKRLHYVSFGIYAEDEEAFAKHLDDCGVTRIDPPAGADPAGTWFAGFDGLPINLLVADKVSPAEKSVFEALGVGPGESGAVFNSKAPFTRPRRLSHFAIYTSDVVGAIDWYERVLGLRLSDGSGPVVAFLHGAHGSDHHLLALVGSSHCGYHHSSWDVASVQEIGLGSAQMMRAGYKKGWGVGRHVLGANYFYYATDPWGSHAEYSADMDFIPADCDWPRKPDHAPEDSFYLWGPDVPEGFVENTEPART